MCDADGVATGALPTAMASTTSAFDEAEEDGQLFDTGVHVGEETLNDSLKPVLQRFCDSSGSPAEKAKALELLTALEMSETIKADASGGAARLRVDDASSTCSRQESRRPRTAMPRLQSRQGRSPLSYVNCYETTHNYYFQQPQPSPTLAVRPASSQMQRVVPPADESAPGNSYGDLYMQTTYGTEFFKKPDGRGAKERAASARGVRNNNPHPNQEFMVWRYRRPLTATEAIETAAGQSATVSGNGSPEVDAELTNESFDRAVRGKCRSTYKTDFLGVPPTFDVNQHAAAHLAASAPKFDRSTTTRRTFGKPPPVPVEMATPTVRFSKPQVAPRGIIPAGGVSGHRFGTRARTTYDLHINEPAGRLLRVGDLRHVSNSQNAQAVAKLLEGTTGAERASLMRLYKEMETRKIPVSIPLPVERRILRERVGGHMRVARNPAWMSTWVGP